MPKIAVITCYKQPDYIRAKVLRTALAQIEGVEVIVIKNDQLGPLRYLEVLAKAVKTRFTGKPDMYLLTFRGYEILPFIRLLSWGKTLWFDEFINPLEVVEEHRQQRKGTLLGWLMGGWQLLARFYYAWLKTVDRVLIDTRAHADYAAKRSGLSRTRYAAIPVSTDESLFVPTRLVHEEFTILYYGSMVPLHGLPTVLAAAVELAKEPVNFEIIGGGSRAATLVDEAIQRGAHINYRHHVSFDTLPAEINKASLCLGGPFGDTLQSGMVVTGKTYQFLACGAPTLLGKNTATEQWFTDKLNALMVAQGDSKQLAQAILWAQQNPKELTAIGEAGRKTYATQLSIEVVSRLLKELWPKP